MEFWDISSGWPGGVSDGTTLPCSICGYHTNFDYLVTEELWHGIVPEHARRGVVCLDCLDRLAKAKGYFLLHHLIEIQYTGINETIILRPDVAFTYK